MSKLIFPEKHFLITSSSDVNDICRNFFRTTKIKHCNYFRYQHNGSVFGLTTTPELIKHHIEKEYIFSPYLSNNQYLANKKFSYILIPNSNNKFNQATSDYQNLFGLYYCLYLYEINEDYFDLFTFSYAEDSSEAINYYLMNMDFIENFKLFFKEKSKQLLKQSEKNKILLPPKMRTNFKKSISLQKSLINNDFKKELSARKYTLEHNKEMISITKREIDCLQCLIQGMTAKQTAKYLSLSPRTVENYRDNLRKKTKASNRFEMIDKLKNILGIDLTWENLNKIPK